MTQKRKKIAVLGSGMSALTAVYTLTKTKDWRQKYDITIYQMGWRIGGKGASGRNMKVGKRIEEHGLHIWFGFYTNAFNLIRDVYESVDTGNSPIKTYKDAFKPQSYIPLMENVNGKWENWDLNFPTNELEPGGDVEHLPLWHHIEMMMQGLLDLFRNNKLYLTTAQNFPFNSNSNDFISNLFYQAIDKATSEIKGTFQEIVFKEGEKFLENIVTKIHEYKDLINSSQNYPHSHILLLMENFWAWFKNKIGNLIYTNATLRRLFIIFDIGFTIIGGILRDGVLEKNLDILNNIEFMDWLRKHGAADITINSTFITALYDVGFAYENGDITKRNYEAGSAIRIIMRLVLTYKGAFMWKMQTGMGDTIFTPIYNLFESYKPSENEGGIEFKFFHKVKNLGLSSDESRIDTIKIEVQATTKDNQPYKPLVDVKNIPCWTSTPDYSQLNEGEALQSQDINLESFWTPWKGEEITLEFGKDYDMIILGTPVASLPHICPELINANPKWLSMIENVKTTQTQAYQLWLNKDLKELGWDSESPIMTSFVEPVDTWADMSQLIACEDFPEEHEPKNIAYYCGVMKDASVIPPPTVHSFPESQHERTRKDFLEHLTNAVPIIFPELKKDGLMDWNVLVDIENRQGERRLESQFWRANIDPNERYTLTNVNSSIHRLKTDETGFSNLYITGDWIQTNFNYGCIECCVMAGMMTARAISGEDIKIIGEESAL